MKLSEIYGMRVVAADGGGRGYIVKVYANGEKITGFLCADEQENEFYVPSSSARFSNGALNFTYGEKAKPSDAPLSLGKNCYNVYGDFIGVLKDINCRGTKLVSARIGAKNYAAENIIFGDAVIVMTGAALKADVIKNGNVIFKRGERADKKLLDRAISLGEYVQTNLKTI